MDIRTISKISIAYFAITQCIFIGIIVWYNIESKDINTIVGASVLSFINIVGMIFVIPGMIRIDYYHNDEIYQTYLTIFISLLVILTMPFIAMFFRYTPGLWICVGFYIINAIPFGIVCCYFRRMREFIYEN